jgi:DNA-binding MarR family transcriptional regulator
VTPDGRWLDADEQAAWRGWLDTYRLLIPVLDRHLQLSRVSLTEYEVLVCLSEATDQRLRMSEVADRTLATRSAITRTVDRLVARGWVRRLKSMQDQRGAYANLTGPGAQALAELAPGHVKAVRENLIDLLTPAEMEALRSIGRRVKQRLAGRDGWSPRTSADETDAEEGTFADLTGSDLTGSDLTGSELWESDLGESDLTGSDLGESDLTGSDLTGSDLGDSDLTESDPPGPDTPGSGIAGVDTTAGDEPVIAGPDR